VLCGEESSDGATAQVPPGIAEWLDLPQVTYALTMDLDPWNRRLRAKREIKGGHELLLVHLPAVVSVKMGVNEPRFLDWSLRPWGERRDLVTLWSLADLPVDPEEVGVPGSATIVGGAHQSETRERRRELLSGTPREEAHKLFERIKQYLSER
jgi:electron transfer flavoprotein beta subunit